jgi:hypothetical protein
MDAIETDLQIGAALGAGFEPAGAAGEFVFAAAIMAMTSHGGKFQNPNPKIQINPKIQDRANHAFASLLEFEIWIVGVCLKFGFWDLDFFGVWCLGFGV